MIKNIKLRVLDHKKEDKQQDNRLPILNIKVKTFLKNHKMLGNKKES